MIVIVGEAVSEQSIQFAPGGQCLAQPKLTDRAAGGIQRIAGVHFHADPIVDRHTATPQRREQLRMRDDAGAAPGQRLCDTLEHVHLPAVVAQQVCREQSAQGTADDQCSPLLKSCRFRCRLRRRQQC